MNENSVPPAHIAEADQLNAAGDDAARIATLMEKYGGPDLTLSEVFPLMPPHAQDELLAILERFPNE
jgi:hypothetical protein